MITVTFTDGTTTHTVHTEGEVLDLVKRYFPKVKIGDKVRILTDGGFESGANYIGSVLEVKYVYEDGTVRLSTGMHGESVLWNYEIGEYELVKE